MSVPHSTNGPAIYATIIMPCNFTCPTDPHSTLLALRRVGTGYIHFGCQFGWRVGGNIVRGARRRNFVRWRITASRDEQNFVPRAASASSVEVGRRKPFSSGSILSVTLPSSSSSPPPPPPRRSKSSARWRSTNSLYYANCVRTWL